jgi:hypothetical protein
VLIRRVPLAALWQLPEIIWFYLTIMQVWFCHTEEINSAVEYRNWAGKKRTESEHVFSELLSAGFFVQISCPIFLSNFSEHTPLRMDSCPEDVQNYPQIILPVSRVLEYSVVYLNKMMVYLNRKEVLNLFPMSISQLHSTYQLLARCNVERPFKEVKARVRKQYPSVQLSAWMVCNFHMLSLLPLWVSSAAH